MIGDNKNSFKISDAEEERGKASVAGKAERAGVCFYFSFGGYLVLHVGREGECTGACQFAEAVGGCLGWQQRGPLPMN